MAITVSRIDAHMIAIILYWLIMVTPIQSQHTPYKAVVIVPVAEMVGSPFMSDKSSHALYATIPLCGGPAHGYSHCPRIHQLLFNETVTVLKEQGDQAYVALPNIFYTDSIGIRHNTFWTHKASLVSHKMLLNRGCSLDTIPSPLDADRTMTTPRNTVTLQSPWYDPVSQQTFSVGTRFVKANEQLSSDNGMVSVMILDPQQFIFMPTEIPKKVCAPHYFANNQEKIAHFVALIRHWATAYNGFIPYVFGGCSFTNTAHAPFTARHVDKETKIYEIADTQTPKTGMDCAGLVARAAQVCDIPYFLKNTATLARHLHAVQHDGFSEGDLIWIPGHVMVISDIKNNLLVEARGYDHGYGKVQEIELKKVFKDIATYDDLHYAHMQKIPLRRMDKQGTIRETFPEWKVLKLSSVWLE